MIKILPPLPPKVPEPPPGMRLSVEPSPHYLFVEDYEYYDQLGRDPLQQNKIWSINDPDERVKRLKELLKDYPRQIHRRKILFKAAIKGDEAIVRHLVDTGLKIHPNIARDSKKELDSSEYNKDQNDDNEPGIPDENSPSVVPLHAAAANGKLECLKILLEANVGVDIRDEFGRTPLIAASGHKEVVEYLLKSGADPTARSYGENELTQEYMGQYAGASALEVAAGRGNVDVVRQLLDHLSCEPTKKRKIREDEELGNSVTPLAIKAAAGGNFETLKLLLERGGYLMKEKDDRKILELLDPEQRQAVIDATPIALELGDLESIKLLLSYQYHVNEDGNILPFKVPEELYNPFIYGAYHAMTCDAPGKFEFLQGFGLKEHETMSLDILPDGQFLNIQHLLDKAAENGSMDCVRLLTNKYNANPNRCRLPPGVYPLYMAAANNKPEVVRYLLESYNADVHLGNGRFAAGPTALWISILLKSFDCITLLLQHGGPVDHVDEEILNASKQMTGILLADSGSRAEVRFESENSAGKFLEEAQADWQNLNPHYVRIEIDSNDRSWISKLQPRKSDDELREKGEEARELNKEEALMTKDLSETDPRRKMVDFPTVLERDEQLKSDNELLPKWSPAFVPIEKDEPE